MRRIALLALALAACAPNPKAPVKVMAIVPNVAGDFETRAVDLVTVVNVTALKGTIAELVGGNRVVVDAADPLQAPGIDNMTDDQRFAVLVKDTGSDVRANFIERSGVLWPADFHSWNMVSTYYNFELAYFYYQAVLPEDPPELQKMRVMYWPEVHWNSAELLTDNALYLSLVKSFVMLPPKSETKIPMMMNDGIIGHEMGHKVFGKRVLNDAGVHAALGLWTNVPFNLLKSLDEGLADFHGYGVTCTAVAGCRSAFLVPSVGDAKLVAARDLARPDACLSVDLRNAFINFTPSQWVGSQNMYGYGTLIAAALYQAAAAHGKLGTLQKAVLAAYDDDTNGKTSLNKLVNSNLNTSSAFSPEAVIDSIVEHIADVELQRDVCSQAATRLQLKCTAFPCTLMPHCPSTAAVSNACPKLP